MKVYLIDDDHRLRAALQEVLQRAGHEVRVAENGLATRRMLQEWPVDLVICDMLMPGAEVSRCCGRSGRVRGAPSSS